MHHKATVVAIGSVSVAAIALLAVKASGQDVQAVIGNVFLQNTTPGTSQVGHATITGTFRSGQIVVNNSNVTAVPVIGNNTSGQPNGVGGSFSAGGAGGIGLRGTATSIVQSQAIGVYGESRGKATTGVRGVATQNGTGVAGVGTTAVAGTGELWGSYFSASDLGGTGVEGDATSQTGSTKGGLFQVVSPTGVGAYGYSGSGTGVGYGVVGQSQSANGYGLYALGRTGASGVKSFRIDHPTDPENKYLLHYSAEGPEPLNVYTGTVQTGPDGYVTVRLPGYFEAINKDPRVQLTVDDSSEDFVSVKVVGGVHEGLFRLRTSKPGVKVYWEVKAVRNDLWVRKYGAPVEVEKLGADRGTYQHPELYGQPESRSWARAHGVRATKAPSGP